MEPAVGMKLTPRVLVMARVSATMFDTKPRKRRPSEFVAWHPTPKNDSLECDSLDIHGQQSVH